jgi:hypothetical protein
MVSRAQTRSSLLTLTSHEMIPAPYDRVVTAWLEAPLEAGIYQWKPFEDISPKEMYTARMSVPSR